MNQDPSTPTLLRAAIRRLPGLLRQYGLVKTATVVIDNAVFLLRHTLDRRFDRRHGVETVGRIELASLSVRGANKGFGVYYEPTPHAVFHRVISELDIDLESFEFIDLGCGKGRVMFMAARYPFARITGVEFANELAQVAVANIGRFRDPFQQCRALQVLTMDAADFEIPSGKAVIYLFNPFETEVMTAFLCNLEQSIRHSPTEKIVIYYHPQSARLFESMGFLKRVAGGQRVIDLASPQMRGYAVYRTVDNLQDWVRSTTRAQ